MNNTNRALNRALIFVVGLLLLALGIATIAEGSSATVRGGWLSVAPMVSQFVAGWFASALIPGTNASWWSVAILAVLFIMVVALLCLIFRQGHGRTARLIEVDTAGNGRAVVESRVAEQLVQDWLDGRAELVSSHVSTYLVGRTPALKVAVTVRRGVSPKVVVQNVEDSLASLSVLLGYSVAASVQVSGGFRARTTSATRLP